MKVRALGALAVLLVGCNGAFHFAGGSDDGATGGLEDAAAGESLCAPATCPWSGTPCPTAPAACSPSCPAGHTCAGSCGESCTATCETGATCQITVGEGSASCQAGSTCTVVCRDECNVSCDPSAQCMVQCPGATAPALITATIHCFGR